jgi:ABC-2 type transport system ATP-binding protein
MTPLFSSPGTLPDQHDSVVARLRGATKRFGTVVALDNLDLEIRRGEFVALLGPNGAGKTTAINLLLGLRAPTAGVTELLGLAPTDRRARSRCGVMLQQSGVPTHLSVREILRLFASHYPKPLPIDHVLALADLQRLADSRPTKLSGGELQRLYYAIAICGDPEVLFLDEPTVGMDVATRHRFYEQLRDFSGEGRTLLLTTHYLEEADELAGRIVVIDHGRVAIDGSPAAVRSRVPGKRITIHATRALVEADFAGLPTGDLRLGDHTATMLSNDPVAVLEGLVARAIPMVDLEVTGAALEDAFLALTAPGT